MTTRNSDEFSAVASMAVTRLSASLHHPGFRHGNYPRKPEFFVSMKTLLTGFIAGLLMVSASAAEPPKEMVTLTAKLHVLDSDRDLRGRQGNTREKTVALRVEIVNATAALVGESELSGHVLVKRAKNDQEKIVQESLDPLKVPALKPNGKVTLDLGRIRLSEVEWRNRKFEETLEEWKVICSQGGNEIGKAVSNRRYENLSKDVEPEKKGKGKNRKKPGALAE